MVEITLLIPVASNSGVLWSEEHHAAFERLLTDTFGGFTQLPGEGRGGWESGQRMYHDTLRAYVVFVDGILSRAVELLVVTGKAKAHYGQEAITVRYMGMAEIL